MTTTDMTVANEIRNQIGNLAFRMMGASNLAGDAKSLLFKIRGSQKVTHVTVTLDVGSDTYTVRFCKVRGRTVATVAEVSDVYCDNLKAIIESNTGLYLSL